MSLRDRLGRVWGRSSDSSPRAFDERPATQTGHRRLLSEIDAHRPTVPSFSPRKLHKAASTTFQAFSESLRSRAQAFYVNFNEDDAAPSNEPEPKTPKRSPRRSALWSSVRSRRNREPPKIVPTPEPAPETSSAEEFSPVVPYGPVPQVQLHIPDLSLRDPQGDDDVTTPPVTPERQATTPLTPVPSSTLYASSRQIWPSPHTQLKNLSIAQEAPTVDEKPTGSNGQIQSSLTGDASQTVATPEYAVYVPADAADNDKDAIQEQKKRDRYSGDASGVSDESTAGTLATIPSTARTSLSRRPSLTKDLRDFPRAAEFGSSEDIRGTFWPATKVIKSSKRSSRSSTPKATESMGQSAGPPIIHADATERLEAASGGSDAYEADDEEHASGPPSVSMGPRGPWQEARARREKRYLALDAENTDVDTDFGEELTASPPKASDSKADGHTNLSRDQEFAQKGSKTRSLPSKRRLLASTLRKTFKQAPTVEMPESSNMEHPVFLLDEYLGNKDLRRRLLRENNDFKLVEDESTPATEMTVSGRLHPGDAFEAKIDHFPCRTPNCSHPSHSDGNHNLTNGRVLSDHPPSDVTTASYTVPTNDSAPSDTSTSPSMSTEPKFVVRDPVLDLNAFLESLDARHQRGELQSNGMEVVDAALERLRMDGPKAPQSIGHTGDGATLPSEPAPTTPKNARKMAVLSTPSPGLGLDASDLSSPGRGFSFSPSSSLDVERGRSRSRSVSDNAPRQASRGLSSLPSRRNRIYIPSARLHPSPASGSHSPPSPLFRRTSYGPLFSEIPAAEKTWKEYKQACSFGAEAQKRWKYHQEQSSFGPQHGELWEAEKTLQHHKEEYARECAQAELNAQSDEEADQEPRVRLADISMVERRQELLRKAYFNVLCKIIYRCEADAAAAEETSSSEDESDEEQEQAQEQEEQHQEAKGEEGEAGYTTAMFQGE